MELCILYIVTPELPTYVRTQAQHMLVCSPKRTTWISFHMALHTHCECCYQCIYGHTETMHTVRLLMKGTAGVWNTWWCIYVRTFVCIQWGNDWMVSYTSLVGVGELFNVGTHVRTYVVQVNHLHTCIHTNVRACIHAYTCIYICIYTYIRMYVIYTRGYCAYIWWSLRGRWL